MVNLKVLTAMSIVAGISNASDENNGDYIPKGKYVQDCRFGYTYNGKESSDSKTVNPLKKGTMSRAIPVDIENIPPNNIQNYANIQRGLSNQNQDKLTKSSVPRTPCFCLRLDDNNTFIGYFGTTHITNVPQNRGIDVLSYITPSDK